MTHPNFHIKIFVVVYVGGSGGGVIWFGFCLFVCLFLCMCICVCVSVFVCVCVSVFVCVCICIETKT